MMRAVEIDLDQTYELRLAVLRDNTPTKDVTFPEDQWPGVFHLGIRDELDRVVAISSWVPRDLNVADGRQGVQLRGMATARTAQRSGAGGILVEAGVARCQSLSFGIVWANARDTALAFYTRHGFEVMGAGFVEQATRLPHHVVVRTLGH